MYAYTYRYSCYDCKFAQLPRQGDITLADYWGVDKFFPDLERTKGVSLIIVNTQQGRVVCVISFQFSGVVVVHAKPRTVCADIGQLVVRLVDSVYGAHVC